MLDITRAGPVTTLRMAHGKASAFDLDFLRALREALADQAADDGVRAVVLTGTGTIFSAGVDLRRLLDGGRPYIERFVPELEDCATDLLAFGKPLVAAINGHAIAGGCMLACACDARLLAADSSSPGRGARLGMPELKVGVPFPSAVLETVRQAVPPQTFHALVLRGVLYGPAESLAHGLVDELVPPSELLPRALAVAHELAAMPPLSFAETKRLVREPVLQRLRTAGPPRRAWLIDAWSSDGILAAVRRYVEATLGAR